MPNRPTKDKAQQGPGIETTPTRLPETTPPIMPSGDYSYTVEIVMHMQRDLGKLSEAVEGLKERQSEQGHKLDVIGKQIYAAIALITIIGAILMFFAKSINDVITNRLFPPPTVQQIVLPTPTPTPQKTR
jgi:hypothetical protein